MSISRLVTVRHLGAQTMVLLVALVLRCLVVVSLLAADLRACVVVASWSGWMGVSVDLFGPGC